MLARKLYKENSFGLKVRVNCRILSLTNHLFPQTYSFRKCAMNFSIPSLGEILLIEAEAILVGTSKAGWWQRRIITKWHSQNTTIFFSYEWVDHIAVYNYMFLPLSAIVRLYYFLL